MEPIDTEYKGYRFRSRLEARWAVFFQHLGVEWQYEPEGYEFENGTRYLPDFYLPYTYSTYSDETYVEVKPEGTTDTKGWDITSRENEAELSFARSLILLSGRPRAVDDEQADFINIDYNGYVYDDNIYYFCQCTKCKTIGFEFNGRAERIQCSCSIFETHTQDAPRLPKAYNAASKARFEHGESGVV